MIQLQSSFQKLYGVMLVYLVYFMSLGLLLIPDDATWEILRSLPYQDALSG